MISSDDNDIRVLNNLILIARDAERGFQKAATVTRDPELARVFCDYAVQRAEIVADLEERVRLYRAEPREQGSFAGGVHRKLMELEAEAADHVDHTVLAEIERGEDFAVMAYRDALQVRDLDERTRKLIQQQYE